MIPSSRGRANDMLAMSLAVGLIAACFLFGGSARADAFSQFFVRIAAVLLGSVALVRITRADAEKIRVPLILSLAWTLLIAIQLVPLPPQIWTSLPGREQFVELAGLAGLSQPWREMSLVPEATLNSLLAMIVPLAVLAAVCQVPSRLFGPLLAVLVLLALLSGLIGVVQVAAGGSLYFYKISNQGDAVGLFANRNHQAAMLAACVPMLAGLAAMKRDERRAPPYGVLAAIVFVLVFPLVFVTGSRSGVIWLLLGVAGAALVMLRASPETLGRMAMKPVLLAGGLAIAAAGAALAFFRVGAIDRMLTRSVEEDLRFSLLGTMVEMAGKYFPLGGGFGSFPMLFKVDEPFDFLNERYFNHAHNDLLEIVIEGGLPAVLIVLAFLAWFTRVSIRLWLTPYQPGRPQHLFGLVASVSLLVLLLAGLVDYPLRTPGLAALASVLTVFISRADKSLSHQARVVVPPRRSA